MGPLERVLELIHAGQLAPARVLCKEILAKEPRNFNALQLAGHIALREGDYSAAASSLAAARAVNPLNPAVYSNLAVALLALKRPAEALQCCDMALRLKPQFPEAHCNRGNALVALGRAAEAIASYDAALAAAPRFVDAHAGRTRALVELKRYPEALASCDGLLRIDPRSLDGWCLQGSALLKSRRPEAALVAFDRALEFHPDSAEAHNNRGTALRDLRRPGEALAAYERALRLRPQFAQVYCNVANVGLDSGRYEEALRHCDEALRMSPGLLEALNLRGTALRVLKRYAEAAATYEQLLAVAPLYGQAQSHLLSARASLCDWTDRAAQVAHITERLAHDESTSSPHAFLWICDSGAAQLRCATLYSREQFPASTPLWQGERYAHDRLRVAYLSADLSDHPVAHLIAGVLERHDRSRFETFGVALHRDVVEGAMHARMRQAFEHFLDVSESGDRDIARLLREAEIDIAVDLTGHTRGGRLGVLACRPAPVQINFLGYTGTAGADYIDYIIGDQVAIPAHHESFFSEHIVRMPHSFLPNDDRQPIAPETSDRRHLGLPQTGFVFCAFNNPYKVNPGMFDVWMRLLDEVPGSVLWLRAEPGAVSENLTREAAARGVASDRLVFAPRMDPLEAHLARYRQADLFLDTVPYGAHATARDALWAGLPVLTCAGESFASRVAASLLSGLGLEELITGSLQDYASQALKLARSPGLLGELRAALAQRRGGALFDTGLYRQHLESAYVALSARQRRGEAPANLTVADIR
jgi:predicted O-linked N-acetylglucosamine transferase (SPINDLY family)